MLRTKASRRSDMTMHPNSALYAHLALTRFRDDRGHLRCLITCDENGTLARHVELALQFPRHLRKAISALHGAHYDTFHVLKMLRCDGTDQTHILCHSAIHDRLYLRRHFELDCPACLIEQLLHSSGAMCH